jgi:catechol 2,3-dioxygenase-like lactoylglutathione lyase family enzyme
MRRKVYTAGMSNFISAFSGVSVSDLGTAKDFYVDVLGLDLVNEQMGLRLELPGGGQLFIYEKPDHEPASFTVLNLVVEDVDSAVDELSSKGVTFERYDLGNGVEQDDKGILRGLSANMGPDIAWFKDPAGNILAVLQEL